MRSVFTDSNSQATLPTMKLILAFSLVVLASMSDAAEYQKRKFDDSVGAAVHAAKLAAEKPELHKILEAEMAKYTGEEKKSAVHAAVEAVAAKYQDRKVARKEQELPLDDLTPAEIQQQYEEALKEMDKYGVEAGKELKVPKHRGPGGPFPEFPRKPHM